MDDESEGRSEGTVKFDLGLVLHSGSLVHFGEHEGLHRVNVNNGLDERVGGISQGGRAQRLFESGTNLTQ